MILRFVLFCFLTYSPFLIFCCLQHEWAAEICFPFIWISSFPNIVCWDFFSLNCLRTPVQNKPVSHICKPVVSQKRLPNYLEQRRGPMGVVGHFPDVNHLKQLRVTKCLAISPPGPWDSASSIGQCRSTSALHNLQRPMSVLSFPVPFTCPWGCLMWATHWSAIAI